jgi:hypothetical protein
MKGDDNEDGVKLLCWFETSLHSEYDQKLNVAFIFKTERDPGSSESFRLRRSNGEGKPCKPVLAGYGWGRIIWRLSGRPGWFS